MSVSIQLLGLLTFDHLTSLELSCDYAADTNQRSERTRALIKAINNTPPLEKLVYTNAAVKIADMENLHAAATKLKSGNQ